jgi:hypothetical protein
LARIAIVVLTVVLWLVVIVVLLSTGRPTDPSTLLTALVPIAALAYAAWRDRERDRVELKRLEVDLEREQRTHTVSLGRQLLERRWDTYPALHSDVVATGDALWRNEAVYGGSRFAKVGQVLGDAASETGPAIRIADVQKWLRENGLLISDETSKAITAWIAATGLRDNALPMPPGPDKGAIVQDQVDAEGRLVRALRKDLRVGSFDELGR